MRSLVVPIVAELALRNRHLRVELFSRELRELFPLLASNQVDFVLTSEPVDRVEIVSELLGYESNVLVRPRYSEYRSGVFLDHDADDSTTFDFLKLQGRKSEKFERFYLDEVYAIMDGVANGMGEAVLPLHLVKTDKRMRIVDGLKPLKTPIFLQYYKQPFYSKIHTTIVERLLTEIPKKLDI
jgi:DNA-binding transcriptional LysR family regulator